MTEIQQWTAQSAQPATYVPDYQSRAVARLSEWAQSAEAAYVVAERLVQSSFVPAGFKGKPIEAAAAILAGSEVGLSPMAALRSFDVIQGQAAPRAITLRAIVQSFGHEVVVESTATRCLMRGRRRGSSEWQQSLWTLDRAKDLGLTSKDGWKKQPTAMLVARATSEICRLVAADAILGIGYTTEELNDGATGDPWDTAEQPSEPTPAPAATRTMSRRRATPEPEQEPDNDIHDAEEVDDEQPEPKLSARNRGRLFALFTQKGIPEAEQLAGIARVIGRTPTHRDAINEDEFALVVHQLESLPDAEV